MISFQRHRPTNHPSWYRGEIFKVDSHQARRRASNLLVSRDTGNLGTRTDGNLLAEATDADRVRRPSGVKAAGFDFSRKETPL